MGHRTALYEKHIKANGKMVDFAGWDMPIHYGSQIEEHHTVRQDAGMFDVSHMIVTDLKGEGVFDFLRLLLANDVAKLRTQGKALYSCMLTTEGTIIDDLIVYYVEDNWFRIVSNAGTHEKDLAWINKTAETMGGVEIIERPDLSIIAVQGPKAKEKVYAALGDHVREVCEPLKYFHSVRIGELFIATTGYTGEEGFEIILPSKAAPFTWDQLLEAGVKPAGLGARDTLRLEAGMALYGSDMSEHTTPLEASLGWTIALEQDDRRFIGRDALEKQKADGVEHKLVGLLLEDKGILRRHQEVEFEGLGKGEITSGGFAPTLNQSVALASVPAAVETGSSCKVGMRGRELTARVVKYPFVRNGKSCLN
ncbi:MAG: glycine cleavage system aminomethyltransferase GcvT [Proteobacteria bacterium]|nr:glycine cleavage system aminomethyltransferase GcvT [Pseudomonadota bacterium]